MNILITGAWNDALKYIDQIEAHGHHVLFMQQEKDQLPCQPEWLEGVICNGLFLYHDISLFKNLRYIQLTSAGYDRVPLDYIRQKGITIYNARGVYSVPMAEHAVMGILELYRKAHTYYEHQKNKLWYKDREMREIGGKEVLIIGCGSVGIECAKRLKAFNTHIKGIDIQPYESEYFEKIYPFGMIDHVIRSADIVILTVPLTEETIHMINTRRLELMKSTAVLINISRGKVVEEAALAEALTNCTIYGAFLDVFEDEPLTPNAHLWECQNAILTPHVSFIGDGNSERLWVCIAENLFEKSM